MRSSSPASYRATATDGHRQTGADHQLDQELNRQLLDVAVDDLADRRLWHFQRARRFRLAPALAFDVIFESCSKLATNVERRGVFGRETKVKKWVVAHIKQQVFG